MDQSANKNIRDETDASTENENRSTKLVEEIKYMLRSVETLPSLPCIYKVPDTLRKLNEEAYIPQIISIGPFHRGNQKLQSMEKYKVTYLKSFMRRCDINLENLVSTIKDWEESVRQRYAEAIPIDSDAFIKMVLVDASFIIEFFLRSMEGIPMADDVTELKPWMTDRLQLDLILLENQLPFFIIEKLYSLAFFPFCSEYALPFIQLAFKHFKFHNVQEKLLDPEYEIMHFVDLLRYFYLPRRQGRLHLPPRQRLSERDTKIVKERYCASQLADAGMKFKLSSSKCLLDFEFKNGVLEIPFFTLDKATEIYARNLIALEQCHYPNEAYVTDYFFMLDFLIDTGRDVDLLVRVGILVNELGEKNAGFSSNLCTNISYSTMNPDYYRLCEDLKEFYGEPWHIMKATLRHDYLRTLRQDYFRTPWMGAATLGAVILLVLTLIQTVCTVVPLL